MTRNRIRTAQELEELAREMAELGFSEPEIAKYLDFEKSRRVKHGFVVDDETPEVDAPDVAAGEGIDDEQAVKSLYEMATSGKNAAATMFWLRCRLGWTPKSESAAQDDDIEMVFGPYVKDDE